MALRLIMRSSKVTTSEGCINTYIFLHQYVGLHVSNAEKIIYSMNSGNITYQSFTYSDNL